MIHLLVSRCLLGHRCRYDGGHCALDELRDLPQEIRLRRVCPEEELGMGTPREPVALLGDPAAPRMIGRESGEDWTARMNRWSERRVGELAKDRITGVLLKARSPSCGNGDVELFPEVLGRLPRRDGSGLFVLALRKRMPGLPLADEEDLRDPRRRAAFLRALRGRDAR